ncbi:hypothetical protein CVT26_007730, partial [Gymnopilus dilepis]
PRKRPDCLGRPTDSETQLLLSVCSPFPSVPSGYAVAIRELMPSSRVQMSPKKKLRSRGKAPAQQEKEEDHLLQTAGSGYDDEEMPKEKTKRRRKPSASPLPPTPSRLRPDIKTTPKGRHLAGASAHRKELVDQTRQQSFDQTLAEVHSVSPSSEHASQKSSSHTPFPTIDYSVQLAGQLLAPPVMQAGQESQPQLVFHPTYGWGYVMQPMSPMQGVNGGENAAPSQVTLPASGPSGQGEEPQNVQLPTLSNDAMCSGSTLALSLQHDKRGASRSLRGPSGISDDPLSVDGVDNRPSLLSPASRFSSAPANRPYSSHDWPESQLESSCPSQGAAGQLSPCSAAVPAIQLKGKGMAKQGSSIQKIDDLYPVYKAYFYTKVEEELQRLPEEERPEDTADVTDSLIEAAYEFFKKETPDYQALLSDWWQIYQIANNKTEFSIRPARFDAYARKLQALADHASTLLGFETAVYVVGRDIQTDQALSTSICSPLVRSFFQDRLCVSETEVMAHLKAHVYDGVSKRSLPKIPRAAVVRREDQRLLEPNEGRCLSNERILEPPKVDVQPASYGEGVATELSAASGPQPSTSAISATSDIVKIEPPLAETVLPRRASRKKGSEGDPRVEELKKRLFALTKECGIRQLLKGPVQFSKLAEILSSHGWVLQNWPEEMRFPCDIRTGKGVAGLTVQEQDCLLKALQHPQFPLRVYRQSEEALPVSDPAIIGIPPPADSQYTHGRRKFLDEKKTEDRKGLPRLSPNQRSSQSGAPVATFRQASGIANGEGSRKRSFDHGDGSSTGQAVVKKARFAREYTLSDLSEGSNSSGQYSDDDESVSSEDEGRRPSKDVPGEINFGKRANSEADIHTSMARQSAFVDSLNGIPQAIKRAKSAGTHAGVMPFSPAIDILRKDPSHRPPARAALSSKVSLPYVHGQLLINIGGIEGDASKQKQTPEIIVDEDVEEGKQAIPSGQMPPAFWYPLHQSPGFSVPATGSHSRPVPFHIPDTSRIDYPASPRSTNFKQPVAPQSTHQLLQIPNQPLLPFVPSRYPLQNPSTTKQ